ncbi:O-antigen ligase domain-containing protein [Marinobacter daepoensis]|uniref:O-antigen ligase family protein n=1 Tax=Marinobacter daepoensis TaxID=262077 RepID=UPI001C973B88|nr:O-antigen ligase family protein [Marinobacter daepoensis]MBY6032307.1 O-antigen ligase domain-containing protein [Marinobacter daepoensis]
MAPENTEERIVWFALTKMYLFYFLGALYVVGPVLGWTLFALAAYRYITHRLNRSLPIPVLLWLIAMLVMLVCVVVGHFQEYLGVVQLIKSSIGWAKGWALLALFILAGACLNIRLELLTRAAMKVCLHTLLLLPLFIGAWIFSLPETPYVSPLKAIGGPGAEFFAVSLYELDPGSGLPRWRIFTPWAPALGFMANIFFLLALNEKEARWRWIGLTASMLMILMSQSRLAILVLLFVLGVVFALRYLRGAVLAGLLVAAFQFFAFFGAWLLQGLETTYEGIKAARADSTRVREALARIAIERWRSEAPIWGHGVVEKGPHLVEYMPIGSHHSWYGLLFVKGLVGFMALAVPMTASLLILIPRVGLNGITRTGCLSCGLLFFYTFGENLEILAYLIWPGLIAIGMAHAEITSLAAKTSKTRRDS